jgi:hypothetical protein
VFHWNSSFRTVRLPRYVEDKKEAARKDQRNRESAALIRRSCSPIEDEKLLAFGCGNQGGLCCCYEIRNCDLAIGWVRLLGSLRVGNVCANFVAPSKPRRMACESNRCVCSKEKGKKPGRRWRIRRCTSPLRAPRAPVNKGTPDLDMNELKL